jgi:hypothetical protein
MRKSGGTTSKGGDVEKKFTSDEVPLAQVLEEARTGTLQLPDFQRSWVWDDGHIVSLLASISLSYPIGAVMTLQTGNPDVKFRPRMLQGVAPAHQVEPEVLLLDGQQRTTSLYLALRSEKPVPTQDARGRQLSRWYYADIMRCLDPEIDREEAIVSVPAEKIIKTFQGEVVLDVSTREKEIAAGMFPLSIVLDYNEATLWQLAYLQANGAEPHERLQTWQRFHEGVINAFVQYQVPAIQLVKSTPKEAVCQVFEKVNTGGVSLTVFELLTATYAADDFNLRDDWTKRRGTFEKHAVTRSVKETDFIQTVTLLATFARRSKAIESLADPDKAPAVSCKRRDILRLDLNDYLAWADAVERGLERTVPFLHTEHVFAARDIPYETQLVPLAAILAVLGEQGEGKGPHQKLARWYWCGVFGEMYGGSTETRFALDLVDVVAWIRDGGEEPRTVRDAQFQAERLLTLRTRNAAAYKGIYALQMKRGARDFRTGKTIDVHAYVDDAIDIHHIFPQAWCRAQGIDEGLMNSVVNKTPVDAHTNRLIGGAPPSKYLGRVEAKAQIGAEDLDAVIRSHEVDPVTLRHDQFAAFFNERFERIIKLVESAMGKAANRTEGESPLADPGTDAASLVESVEALIAGGESKIVEFKSTGRKNLHTDERDPKIEWSAIKTLAGFMNAHGGTLLIGVDDDGETVGIEHDLPFVKGQDADGWELWLTDAVTATLGKSAAADLDVRIVKIGDRSVARVVTGPAPSPVFAKAPGDSERSTFMVRVNNSTHVLTGQDALNYQKKRWT